MVVSMLLLALGCEEEFKPPPKQAPKAVDKENIVKVETAVPYGKTVACADIFAPDKVSAFVGDVVDIKDKTSSNKEATAVCAILRSGEPPALGKDGTELAPEKKNQILGVQPGDEYCTVTLYCSLPSDPKRFQEQCEKKGDDGNRELDQYSCVHKTQRAAKYAYTYRTIHGTTKCQIEVMGGPSVTDEPMVQSCTRAALDLLSKDGLKNFK